MRNQIKREVFCLLFTYLICLSRISLELHEFLPLFNDALLIFFIIITVDILGHKYANLCVGFPTDRYSNHSRLLVSQALM